MTSLPMYESQQEGPPSLTGSNENLLNQPSPETKEIIDAKAFFRSPDRRGIQEAKDRQGRCLYQQVYTEFYLPPTTVGYESPTLKSNLESLQKAFPNLRDISSSSSIANIKPGMLFRSARPFVDNVLELSSVMVDFLGINTVLDLRSDDLSSNKCEHLSRDMELMLYSPSSATQDSRGEQVLKSLLYRQHRSEQKVMNAIHTLENRTRIRMGRLQQYVETKEWKWNPNQQPADSEAAEAEIPLLLEKLACCHEGRTILKIVKETRGDRKFFVVNYLNTQEVHSRVQEQLAEQWHTVPFLGVCKVSDKLFKTNNAEYYFSKFFIAEASVEESYYEMLENCKRPLKTCLELLLDHQPPFLYHCTLGKDRTGILSMLLLHILGASHSAIMFDYSLTEYCDEDFGDFKLKFIQEMSGLSKKFAGSEPTTMRNVINWVYQRHGSMDNYLDSIGFDCYKRDLLRAKFLLDPSAYKREPVEDNLAFIGSMIAPTCSSTQENAIDHPSHNTNYQLRPNGGNPSPHETNYSALEGASPPDYLLNEAKVMYQKVKTKRSSVSVRNREANSDSSSEGQEQSTKTNLLDIH